MDLVPFIFHERQEPGSQLCAQHCLNNLLQQFVYSEIDLADVARKLDELENAAKYARAPEAQSYNYDDTGFFSISVLEKALQVWDLTLVRWRGEAMRPYQDRPEEQSAFILNLASHWFALRRFGNRTRWYNLNSFLEQPEWISPTYLHMVLKQAEDEGYSVFVVRKAGEGAGEDAAVDPGEAHGWADRGVGELPEAAADVMAVSLGDVSSRGGSFRGASSEAGPSSPLEARSGAGSGRRRRRQEDPSDVNDDDDAERPVDRGSGSSQPSRSYLSALQSRMMIDPEDEDLDDDTVPHGDRFGGGPVDFQYHHRSYDDEDEALQAALRASMEDVPDGYVMPELQPLNPIPAPRSRTTPPQSETTPPATTAPVKTPSPPAPAPADTEESATTILEDTDDEPAAEPSPEELRRARLARFQ